MIVSSMNRDLAAGNNGISIILYWFLLQVEKLVIDKLLAQILKKRGYSHFHLHKLHDYTFR